MTPSSAYDFLVKAGIIRPNERTLEGEEKRSMFLILSLLDPYMQTNNQRFITDHFKYGDKEYHVTFFDADNFEIVEITPVD